MSLYGRFEHYRNAMRNGFFSRVLGLLLGGTLNQKVIAVLGIAILLGGLYYILVHLWQPLFFAAVGLVILHLAIRDHERSGGPRA